MSNLQIIEELCYLVERQAALIRNLASALEQEKCLSEEERLAVEAVQSRAADLIGETE